MGWVLAHPVATQLRARQAEGLRTLRPHCELLQTL